MDRAFEKFLFINSLTDYLAKRYNIPYDDCLNRVYECDLIELIDDDELRLTGDSPIYVWSLYIKRQKELGRKLF